MLYYTIHIYYYHKLKKTVIKAKKKKLALNTTIPYSQS